MSWGELNNAIPWLKNIPNAKELMKYIGIGKAEIKQKAWTGYSGISEEEFDSLSFSDKTIYLSLRKDVHWLLNSINHTQFVKNYLKDYPRLQEWVASFPFEFGFESIIQHLEIFTPQQQQSIAIKVNNIDHGGNDIRVDKLGHYPYNNIVKLLELNPKIFPDTSLIKLGEESYLVRIYEGNRENVEIKYYNPQKENWVPLILNKASEDLFFDNPSITQLSFKAIIKILKEYNLSPKKVKYLLYKIEKGEGGFNSGGFEIRTVGDKKILFDVNSTIPVVYDLTGGTVSKIDLNSQENTDIKEEFKNLISEDENFKVKIGTNIIKNPSSIVSYTSNEINEIFENATPNTWEQISNLSVNNDLYSFLYVSPNKIAIFYSDGEGREVSNGVDRNYSSFISGDDIEDFITALNRANYRYNDESVESLLTRGRSYSPTLKNIIRNPNFPVAEGNIYTYVVVNDEIYRYQTNNISINNRWSDRGRWVGGNSRLAALIGIAGPSRRGRPTGVPNQAAAAAPVAATPAAAGTVNISDAFTNAGLGTGYESLPQSTRRRLSVLASNVQMGGDRGTTARQNQLGRTGTVNNVLSLNTGGHQPSKIYFINMANGSRIASINVQPGNINYIVTATGHYVIDSPRQLLQALQQRNLAEGMKSYMVKNYLALNPHQIDEVKAMLRNHISSKKK